MWVKHLKQSLVFILVFPITMFFTGDLHLVVSAAKFAVCYFCISAYVCLTSWNATILNGSEFCTLIVVCEQFWKGLSVLLASNSYFRPWDMSACARRPWNLVQSTLWCLCTFCPLPNKWIWLLMLLHYGFCLYLLCWFMNMFLLLGVKEHKNLSWINNMQWNTNHLML